MANEFLKNKWRKLFHCYDVNNDNNLTTEDADIFSGNFSRNNNFDAGKAARVKADARRYWNQWLLKGHDAADEETFVANMEKAYIADKAKFRKDARELFSLIMNIVDVNGDRMVSEDEFMVMAKSTQFRNFNENYMKSWPQVKPGYISLDVYLDTFVEFNSNDDSNNIEKERPLHYGVGVSGHK